MKIENIEDLDEAVILISTEYLDEVSYENRMITGLLFSYDFEGIGENPFRNWDIATLDKQYRKFKTWANREIQKMYDLIEYIVDDVMENNDEQQYSEEELKDMAAQYAVEHILAWPESTSDWVELKHNLEEDNFNQIETLNDLEQQMRKYTDWDDWDHAFRRYRGEIPYRLVEEVLE